MSKDKDTSEATPQTVVGVLMTRAERELIRAEAKKRGLGLSTFMRMKALEAVDE